MEYVRNGGRSRATLVLEDGAAFEGWSFAGDGEVAGEVVFTTSMVGYQETITDPSYRGQILLFTYPLIGNYGVIPGDDESTRVQAAAVLVREYTPHPSNWASERSLADLLDESGVLGVEGMDTRALTRHLRDKGAMRGVISTSETDRNVLREQGQRPPLDGWPRPRLHELGAHGADPASRLRRGTLPRRRPRLRGEGFDLPGNSVAAAPPSSRCQAPPASEEILAADPDGLFLSNGPGDPAALGEAVDTLRPLLGEVPTFGICLGHQLLGLALGCETYKMPFGHHGANHPVRNLETGRIEITSQNHGFAVSEDSLTGGVELTHRNLYDGTVEGIASPELRAWSVQYHPESSPGPRDSGYLFEEFVDGISDKARA